MNDLAARRAQAPAFPLPGTNYQRQTSALGKPDKKTVRARFWEGAGRAVG